MRARRLIRGRARVIAGWRREPVDSRDRRFRAAAPRAAPPMADLSAGCPRVEDQGDLGSCTANAGSSAVEFLYRKAGAPQPELSRLFLYYATRVWVAGWPADEDDGAFIRDTMKALARYGCAREDAWPYAVDRFAIEPSAAAAGDAATRQIIEYRRCDTLAQVREAIASGYPVEGGFDVPEGMFSPAATRSGVVPMPAGDLVGGHAVLFVGYDDSTELLKFQNSWGKDWGQGGFGFLPYDFIRRGFADDFWTIVRLEPEGPIVPVPPPTPRKRCWLLRWLGL